MSRILSCIAVVMAGALVLVGCGPHVAAPQSYTGSPNQADTTGAQSGASASGLSSVSPCSLIPSSEATKLHLARQTGERTDQNGLRDCGWSYTGSGGAGVTIAVGIDDHHSMSSAESASDGQVERMTIGGRQALQEDDAAGDRCVVAVDYSSSSYVIAVMQSDPSQHPCEGAVGVAKVVVSNLPDNG